MRTPLFLGALAGALALGLSAAAQPAKVGQTSSGTAFTDSAGMSLYTYTRDMPGYSNCNGPCAEAWPPFLAGQGGAASGDWTVIRRDDGKDQWAYKGAALYRYSKDARPGDATGDGAAGGKWRLAKP